MVDIHSHILWGLDDGAKDPEETLKMAQMALLDGITHVIATPHHKNGIYNNPASVIFERVEEVNQLLIKHQIELTILPGMEIHLYGEIQQDIRRPEQILLPLNQTQYILLELPYDHVPRHTDRLIFDLQVEGYIPIIAHPERNREIREHPNILYEMVKKGALAQLTAASLVGRSSTGLKKFSCKLIEHQVVHFIASDAHNVNHRSFMLQKVYQWMDNYFGPRYTDFFQENACQIVSGNEIFVPEPKEFKYFGR